MFFSNDFFRHFIPLGHLYFLLTLKLNRLLREGRKKVKIKLASNELLEFVDGRI